jgi:hypothetical protein
MDHDVSNKGVRSGTYASDDVKTGTIAPLVQAVFVALCAQVLKLQRFRDYSTGVSIEAIVALISLAGDPAGDT